MRKAIRVILTGEIWTPADLDLVMPADAAVADMMRRLSNLTPQQLRVLMMLSQGLLNKQIAYELKVSEATVEGARLRDPAEARRRQPHAGRDRRLQDRSGPLLARCRRSRLRSEAA